MLFHLFLQEYSNSALNDLIWKTFSPGNFPTNQLSNKTARKEWVKLQTSQIVLHFLDGINIDYEDALDPFTPEQYGLTSLVKETADAFRSTLPGLQVSVCTYLYIEKVW